MHRMLLAGGVVLALATAGTAASAGEPVRLSDHVLDALTAGATSGVEVKAQAAVPGFGSSSATVGFTDFSGPIGAGAGTFDGGNTANAQINGNVTNVKTPKTSYSFALLNGETATTGTGTAAISARGLAEGAITFTSSRLFPIPNTNRQIGYALGFAADL